ncbi:GntR family transcriptional regulator [Parablautia muri]|uniref:GntR family transcriptional regulator n=1 Tax=Parablautia muri TaxID=2320879 RepID=A0A9X5GR56_9FIRM|nr:GntR family transcriptional regulator [Parablautia muri]NBJ91705.1 GntR family transcriptional regulator [Parablautia muri]
MSAKYVWLAELLKNLIEEHAGSIFKLPTEAALCKKYGVSRQTVRKALSVLEEEHLIEKRQGSGSYTTGLSNKAEENTAAILICSDTEYIYPSLLADIRNALQKQGFSSTVYMTENQVSKERKILEYLLAHPVRGILSEGCKTAFPTPNQDLYQRLAQKGVSLLFFRGSYTNLPDFPFIKADNYEGGYFLGKYLVSLGHKKIAGIFKSDDMQGPERCHGFLSALRDESVTFQEETICYFDTVKLSALQKKHDTGFLSDFITHQLGESTAIICHNDEIAYWLIKELIYRNLRVPEDVSVVCFGSSYLSDLSPVPITSISHHKHQLGTAAAEALGNLMKGAFISSRKIPWKLNIKKSASSCP